MTTATYQGAHDTCLSIFSGVYATGLLEFPLNAHVLEVGCAEADWMTPMLAIRPDLQITGIDWRECVRPGQVIQGDVLTHDFPDHSFDVMVGISSIEHIGLGHYEEDPIDVDGDIHCMERVARWLKPGGWAYLDVPYWVAGFGVCGTSHRRYDRASAKARLLPGLSLVKEWCAANTSEPVTEQIPEGQPAHFAYLALLGRKG